MTRSEINTIMVRAKRFLEAHSFRLPRFAYWSPEEWSRPDRDVSAILGQQLGWDITDFGSGDFDATGLFMFTIRNGTLAELADPLGKVYAEKILIVEPGQVTPTHFHFQKMEDIINRGGGVLEIQVWNSDADQTPNPERPVTVECDGLKVTVPAGGIISLEPGDSVCLPQRLFHKFWGRQGAGTVLVGEVSRVNDDRVDNFFAEDVGRFPSVVEDEPPLHLLTADYASVLGPTGGRVG